MNEDDIVNFKTAELAKEKGFNGHYFHRKGEDSSRWWDSKYCYDPDDETSEKQLWCDNTSNSTNERLERLISAPTQSLLQKWLRKNHDINIFIHPTYRKGKCDYDSFKRTGYTYQITKGDCNYLVYGDFLQHLESDWFESNEMEENEVDKETFDEYLERRGKSIHLEYEDALEQALQDGLELITKDE